jgi:hypothetical protein
MRNDNVKPDFYAVAIDETRFYNIDPDDSRYIESIMGVYIFDANTYNYLCELTPSYHLSPVYTAVYFNSDAYDADVVDALDSKYAHCGMDDSYVHVSDIRSLMKSNPKRVVHYGAPGDDSAGIDEVREHYQGNCPF